MEVRLHHSVDEFRDIAEPLYRRDPVVHTIELTLLRAGAFPDDSTMLTIWNNGGIVGAALQTPPYPLACSGIPTDTASAVASALARLDPSLHGVRGVEHTAVAFADAWRDVTGQCGTVTSGDKLYRLGALLVPQGVAGSPRLATDSDRALLVDWVERFFADAFGDPRDDDPGERFVDNACRVGDRFVLWDVDGSPRSMAMLRAPAADVSRIGPVFTPRDERSHGYGSAVTAAAVQLAHRSGTADVVLFADIANPTSNAIYRRIGFEPANDWVRISFVAPD
ncbi:GNAT family N-acetyltransferase [Mycobacterium sp. OAE908]|uniref:GNAT family N-acetyltransferase n=1 Tax=Mycobacterium sp. OAE908 TaxID=2817899 RepID=UPI001AE5998D